MGSGWLGNFAQMHFKWHLRAVKRKLDFQPIFLVMTLILQHLDLKRTVQILFNEYFFMEHRLKAVLVKNVKEL